VFPEIVTNYPRIYGGMGLADLCDAMHAYLKSHGIAEIQKDVYARIPHPAMTPAEAYRLMIAGKAEKVRLQDLAGRTAAVMVVPYPPGIPIWMPGEVLSGDDRDIIDFLLLYEDFDTTFPGFETEIHGVIRDPGDDRKVYSILCLKEDR
jgi:lysine decarboxylase/arginine decarboxylase